MVIYNVTLNVENVVLTKWLSWMKDEHIPRVMDTGFFHDFHFLRLLGGEQSEDTSTYAVQYKCNSVKELADYLDNHAHRLQKEHSDAFGEQVLAFRTMLEEVSF